MGLDNAHVLVRFAKSPDEINSMMTLDGTVIRGALSQLRESKDPLVNSLAERLQDRILFKWIDIRTLVHNRIDAKHVANVQHAEAIDLCYEKVLDELSVLKEEKKAADGIPAILTDKESRSPYKTDGGPRGPVQRINVRTEGGSLIDSKQRSDVFAALRDFKLTRAYFDVEHPEAETEIRAIVEKETTLCC